MSNFYQGKRVLITGMNGFIGSNIAEKLIQKKAEVVGVDLDINKKSLFNLHGLDRQARMIKGDISDYDFLDEIIEKYNIEIIFHLAAEIEVGRSENVPFRVFETNVKGTYNLCELAKKYRVGSLVVASTDKAYGHYSSDKMPYQENYDLRPKYIYETSKAAGDLIAQSYARNTCKLPVVVTRFCNIFGPGQLNPTAIFPDLIVSLLKGREFKPRSNGMMKRDFVFVQDVVDLYLKIGELLTCKPDNYRGEIFNFGTNQVHDVRSVIKDILVALGMMDHWERIEAEFLSFNDPIEIDTQYMNFDKVESCFGIKPTTQFGHGVALTVDWFRQNISSL